MIKNFMTAIFVNLLILIPIISISQSDNNYQQVVLHTLSLFDKYQVVALGENHAKHKDSEFRLSLIKHPRFIEKVDVIVVEFANPLYQDVIDDYTNGKDVPYDKLVKIWRNTTNVTLVWSSPVYEELFKTVREINLNQKKENRIRIVAADPPVNWEQIKTFDDFQSYGHRGSFPIGVIEKEVYNENKKALLIFGLSHVMSIGRGFTDELRTSHPNSLAVIFPPNSESELKIVKPYLKYQQYHLIDLKINGLGELPFSKLYPFKNYQGKLNEAADFILYLGDNPNKTLYAPEEVKNDSSYRRLRKHRLQILIDG